MQVAVRRAFPFLAIAVITLAAACEPVKKHPLKDTPPGQNIAFYFVFDGFEPDGTNVTQSPSPFSAPVCGAVAGPSGGPGTHVAGPQPGQASQTLNPDGSVTLSVVFPDGTPCSQGTSGFAVGAGSLANLTTNSVRTTPGSAPVRPYLAFDVDRDGDFGGRFDAGGRSIGFGTDLICGLAPAGRTLATPAASTLDNNTHLRCIAEGLASANRTLRQLKLGVTIGSASVDRNTPVAVLIAASAFPDRVSPTTLGVDDAHATVDSFTINGVEKL